MLKGAAGGAAIHLEGFRLLWRQRGLWPLAVVPVLFGVLAVALAGVLVVGYWAELWALASGWTPLWQADAWYDWLWIGPARALFALLDAALFVALAAAAILAAWLVANVLAAPFLDVLSRRVEAIVSGAVTDLAEEGLSATLRDAGRSMLEELRKLAFFVSVQASIAAFGILVPGGALIAAPAMTVFTILFLPLDYAGYTLDRRRLRFAERRRWVLTHRAPMLGYGAAAFATFVVPGLNFLALPVLVVSGTLLALRTPLPAGGEPVPGEAGARGGRDREAESER